MYDSVPEEGEIKWGFKRLRNNGSRGGVGDAEEHIKRCLVAARKAEKYRETSGDEEVATTTEGGRPETTAAQ